MLKVRSFLLTLMVAMVAIISVACVSATATPTSTSLFPLTIVGDDGEKVILDKPPERIIAFDGAAVETLFTIDEGGRLVGTHRFVTFPPETENITKVGDAFNINLEKTVELKPDLFFIFFDRFVPDLRKLGIKVLYLKSPETLDGVLERIRLWGRIVGAEAKAESVATDMQMRLDSIEKRLPPFGQGPRVLHEVGDLWVTGNDTFVGQLYVFLGAENVAHDIQGFQQISPEVIVERDPQLIITAYPEGPQVFNDNPAFARVSAVREDKVHSVDPDLLSVEGPRIVNGVEELARLLYPDRFR